jgi:predicted helicase
MTAFDDLLARLKVMSDSERMKGNYFEQLVKQFLLTDGVHAPQYKSVWFWKDYPDRDGQGDLGIDLVAEREDGGVTAIQCKFRAEGHKIQKSEIDSFISNSGKKPFTNRLFLDTTGTDWSPNAEAMLEGQYIPVQRIGLSDLRNSNIDWSSYLLEQGNKPVVQDRKQLRPHQHEAVKSVVSGFQDTDRGQLIMACGTGKTFTSLKIAERMAEEQGHITVLFLVPSLALMSQSLKEWSDNTSVPLHAYAVCSDIKVGRDRTGELTDIQVHDLQIPATTDGRRLYEEQSNHPLAEGMTVVFSTYQSIEAITEAQKAGFPDFDLAICDEAHRTTGVTLASADMESVFVKIHADANVAVAKRLYMTATPRVFNDRIKNAAKEKEAVLASMDNVDLFGKPFYRIGFGEAVTQKLLADYKVLVLGVDVKDVADLLAPSIVESATELDLDDMAKLIGCWNGLAKRRSGSLETGFGTDASPMRRAVAFNKDIATSKLVTAEFEELVRVHLSDPYNDDPTDDLRVAVKHVDGNDNAIVRAERLDWLREETSQEIPLCRVLSNARCLTEGVDVPNLDAVMFLNPRNSQVDVIQAVGRVMRSFKDPLTGKAKKFGYIILPIAIPEGATPETALRDNNRYRIVWQVLQALRSHDERMDATINQLDLNDGRPENIVIEKISLTPKKKQQADVGAGSGGDSNAWPSGALGEDNDTNDSHSAVDTMVQLPLSFPAEEWKNAVYAKIVKECGNRMYWQDWAKDIADIAAKHIMLLKSLIEHANPAQRGAFESFVKGLQKNLNPYIDDEQAIEMLAQHLVTKPVFDAMFATANFTEKNSVSTAMGKVLNALASDDVFEAERASLEKFYASIQRRVADLNSVSAKQSVIIELYDQFFKNAFPRIAQRLGIVFTPVPVVDYILHSADDALRRHFGKSLSDEGVAVLEPFVGTGTFITRLLRSGLIRPEDLERKYKREIFANEIVLLSYYIASINIESVYEEVSAELLRNKEYVPFEGISLTDTFQLREQEGGFDDDVFPENTERLRRQKEADIRVIVMNPPYSSKQKSANDNNANLKYEKLDARIAQTYVSLNDEDVKNGASLYDSYYRAIRWASDRIKDRGIVAFVSNGGFIDGAAAQGLRRALRQEFSSLYVYNLRGNANLKGFARQKEKGNVFGEGTKTPVAIAVLIKDPLHVGESVLHYSDIGDYLSREEKLDILDREVSLDGTAWETITPNEHGDWINQRDESFNEFQPAGHKATKGKDETPAIFSLFSNGVKTNRDASVYNFSRTRLETNISAMVRYFNGEVDRWESYQASLGRKPEPDEHLTIIDYSNPMFSWERGSKASLRREKRLSFDTSKLRTALYRPFVKQWLYFDRENRLNDQTYQIPAMFPQPDSENRVIAVAGNGAGSNFSALLCSVTPDVQLQFNGQVFSYYTYEKPDDDSTLFVMDGELVDGYVRKENITDATLANYRKAYSDDSITKWDIFYYIYGLFHHPEYHERYEADLRKLLPRIPQLVHFHEIALLGQKLGDIHVRYESTDPYPLDEEHLTPAPLGVEEQYNFYAIEGAMSWESKKDRSRLRVNDRIVLSGFPEEAFQYRPNGTPALDWVVERYNVKHDAKTQVLNDANQYLRDIGDPRYIIDLVKRVTTVSVETVKLVKSFPEFEPLKEQVWDRG